MERSLDTPVYRSRLSRRLRRCAGAAIDSIKGVDLSLFGPPAPLLDDEDFMELEIRRTIRKAERWHDREAYPALHVPTERLRKLGSFMVSKLSGMQVLGHTWITPAPDQAPPTPPAFGEAIEPPHDLE